MPTQNSRSRYLTLIFYSCLTLLGAMISVFSFKVSSVYCFVEHANCPPELLAAVRELRGQRLLLVNFEDQVQATIASFPTVRLTSISKVLPGSLYIGLEPQKIEYVLNEPKAQESLIITEDGIALNSTPHPDWPIIYAHESLFQEIKAKGKIGSGVHHDLIAALVALESLNWTVTSIYLPEWETLQVLAEKQPSILFATKQLPTQVQRAKDLVGSLPADEATQVKEIDLRFKLPVLRESISIPRHDSL